MDISALVLNKILQEKNLEAWARLKLVFLDSAYSSIYSTISRYYSAYNSVPNFEELKVFTRELRIEESVAAIELAGVPEVDTEMALDALIDQYTQNETIRLLTGFIDKLPIYDTTEIKDNLANIVLTLDEKTLNTEGVYTMNNIMVFQTEEQLTQGRVDLGFNNTFDATLAGMARQEYLLIGGKRGSGKSICATNIVCNQYESGNTAVLFTIEMSGQECLDRAISILAGVDHRALKQNKLSRDDILKVVKVRADMFLEANELVEEFKKDNDKYKFEQTLVRTKQLKPDNQIIIIDDRALTVTSIDLHLGKLKSRFGEKLTVGVVDYLNQVVLEGGHNKFDWQPQVTVSGKLKELARKYDLVMVSPYQIDASGEARFAKGILDAADIALVMEAHDKDTGALSFSTTKIRGGSELDFTSSIDWSTLRISPNTIDKPEKKEATKPSHKKPESDSSGDLPWNT